MNDRIEAYYSRMFAPEPIPQSVVRLCDKVTFFLNRIDAPSITVRDLAIIAAAALVNDPVTEAAAEPEEPKPMSLDEIPIAEDIDEDDEKDEKPEPETKDQTPTEEFDTGANIPIKTGVMDAAVRTNKRLKALSLAKMEKLSMPELRAHAQEFYGCQIPKQFNKSQAAAFLFAKRPIK